MIKNFLEGKKYSYNTDSFTKLYLNLILPSHLSGKTPKRPESSQSIDSFPDEIDFPQSHYDAMIVEDDPALTADIPTMTSHGNEKTFYHKFFTK